MSYKPDDYQIQDAAQSSDQEYGLEEYSTPKGPEDGDGGGGSGGGGRGGGDPSGADDSSGARNTAHLTAVLALFLLVGAVMGYVKKKSTKSLVFGGGSSTLLLASAFLMKKGSVSLGVRLAFVTCAALTGVMFKRAKDTDAFSSGEMSPTKGVLGVSGVYTAGYLVFCRKALLP